MYSQAPEAGIASLLASRGRNGDSMLVHMAPQELQGLQALAMAHGGELTINPETGLYEANFLKKILPMVAGAVLNTFAPGLGAFGTSLLVGGAAALIEGDLKKGLEAGIGAYSGANIGQALKAASADTAVTAADVAKEQAGKQIAASTVGATPEAVTQAVVPTTPTLPGTVMAPAGGGSAVPFTTGTVGKPLFDIAGAGSEAIKTATAAPAAAPTLLNRAGTFWNALGGGAKTPTGQDISRLVTLMGASNALTPEYQMPEPDAEWVYMPGERNPLYGTGRDQPYFMPGQYYKRGKTGLTPFNPYAPINPNRPRGFADGGVVDPASQQEAMQRYQQMAYGPAPAPRDTKAVMDYVAELNRRVQAPVVSSYPGRGGPSGPGGPGDGFGPGGGGPEGPGGGGGGVGPGYGGDVFNPGLIMGGGIASGYIGNIGGGGGAMPNPYVDHDFYEAANMASGQDLYDELAKESEQLVDEALSKTPEEQKEPEKEDKPNLLERGVDYITDPRNYLPLLASGLGGLPAAILMNQAIKHKVINTSKLPGGAPQVIVPDEELTEEAAESGVISESQAAEQQAAKPAPTRSGGGGGGAPIIRGGSGITLGLMNAAGRSGSVSTEGLSEEENEEIEKKIGKTKGKATGGRIKAMQRGGMTAPNPFSGAVGEDYNFGFSGGGETEYAAAGKLLKGEGDGMSDDIPAVIRGKSVQRAALADGEFVIPADVVSHLGNGSTNAGAKKLYKMMARVRDARTGKTRQAPAVEMDKYLPA